MKLYTIKDDYINYLKKYDSRVPNVDYGERMKPFIGTIFHSSTDYNYFCPISSYKPKFSVMDNKLDFIKIIDYNNKILCAININNMFPVPRNEVMEITRANLSSMRYFDSGHAESLYWSFLKKEIKLINNHKEKILMNAEKIYYIHKTCPNHSLNKRCLNFSLLDEKCNEYEITQALETFPSEEMNKFLTNRYLSEIEGKTTFEYNHKVSLIKSSHVNLSLSKLSKLYGDSFFYGQFDTYAQILYRNINDIKKSVQENALKLSVSEYEYLFNKVKVLQHAELQKTDSVEEELEYQK